MEENAGGGVRREKKGRVERYVTKFAEFAGEKAFHGQGIFQGRVAAETQEESWNGEGFGCAVGGMVFDEVGAGERARGSHLGRGDSLQEASPRWPEPKDKRGNGSTGRPSSSP